MNDSGAPELTIVIPAYNEAERLPRTLAKIDEYIVERRIRAEVIVADDGSEDATAEISSAHQPVGACYCVLRLAHRGKASAVRAGVLAATGEYVLFTDADLSTPIRYADDLLAKLKSGYEVAIGSREGIGATRVGEPGYRHLMGRLFNTVVRLVAVGGINDTQCGFKAFRRDVAHDLFSRTQLHVSGSIQGPRVTGFDVEVLFLARKRGYRIAEVPVYWEHVAGSKVEPLRDSFRMFGDVLRVRWNALRGRYG